MRSKRICITSPLLAIDFETVGMLSLDKQCVVIHRLFAAANKKAALVARAAWLKLRARVIAPGQLK